MIVFAGPTLPRRPDGAWRTLLAGCDLRPPARRGDILIALADAPHTLVLLDGYYYTVPSVTHKELLYALDAGVRVVGAASLGALRAVELAPFGMGGVGRVFEAYRSGALDGDDEVALLHAPAESGYRPLTLALVEVRFALERLVAERIVPAAAATRMVDALKALPFTQREPQRVAELARTLGSKAGEALLRQLAATSVKQDDARLALELAATPAPPSSRPRRRAGTGYLGAFHAAAARAPLGDGRPAPTLLHAWNLAQLFHSDTIGFVRRARMRALLAAAAVRSGIEPPPGSEGRRIRALRRRHEGLLGRRCLPDPEYAEEARFHLLAREARRHLGLEGALAALARNLGLDPEIEGTAFLDDLAIQPPVLSAWALARAFSFTAAFRPALETAAEAEEVQRCFHRWAEGARIARDDLRHLAAGLWGCTPEQVLAEGSRRALFLFSDPSDGLEPALELVTPAERLPATINDYRAKKDLLIRTPFARDLNRWDPRRMETASGASPARRMGARAGTVSILNEPGRPA